MTFIHRVSRFSLILKALLLLRYFMWLESSGLGVNGVRRSRSILESWTEAPFNVTQQELIRKMT